MPTDRRLSGPAPPGTRLIISVYQRLDVLVGETIGHVFTTSTSIEGFCSLHPDEQVKLVVT